MKPEIDQLDTEEETLCVPTVAGHATNNIWERERYQPVIVLPVRSGSDDHKQFTSIGTKC